MNHTFQNSYVEFQNKFLKDCFSIINLCISTQAHNLLIGGNYVLTTDKNEDGEFVPYIANIPFGLKDPEKIMEIISNSKVELYSEDGYTNMADIGRFADIALDMICSKVSGYETYVQQKS